MQAPISLQYTLTEGDEVLAQYPVPDAAPAEVIILKTGLYIKYIVVEPKLEKDDIWLYSKLMEALYHAQKPLPRGGYQQLLSFVEQFIWDASEELGIVHQVEKRIDVLRYYIIRDSVGYGPLHAPIMDEDVEEISLTGYESPVFIVHRKFPGVNRMETNIVFPSEEELRRYSQRLAVASRKSLTVARPILDARLGEHRLHEHYGYEVNQRGTALDIRKFPKQRITITGLVAENMMNPLEAAYHWLLLEHKRMVLLVGSTGSGKTSTLNAILSMVPYNYKIVSIEDSVTGDAEIILQENSRIRRTKIGPFVDGMIGNNSFEGQSIPVSGLKVLTMKGNRVIWGPMSTVYRHHVSKLFVSITTETGKQLTVTGDHSLFSLNDGLQPVPVSGKDLKVGSFIVVSDKMILNDNVLVQSDYNDKRSVIPVTKDNFPNMPADITTSNVLRSKILEIGELHPQLKSTQAYMFAAGNTHLEMIAKIDSRVKSEFVYDVSVPETENFIANSFVAHNTPELSLMSHPEWLELVTRTSFGASSEYEIKTFDLVKSSLRERPDIVVVGEVRGAEAQDLFQSAASVTGDTPVLIRKNGVVSWSRIGQVVDGYYNAQEEWTPKTTNDLEILTVDKAGIVNFAKTAYVLRHSASEVYKIDYIGGSVKATGSHSVLVVNDHGDIVPKLVSQLTQHDTLVSFSNSHIKRKQTPIDAKTILTDFNDKRAVMFENGMMQYLRIPAVPESIPITKDLMVYLGAYFADGCVRYDHRQLPDRITFSFGLPEKDMFIPTVKNINTTIFNGHTTVYKARGRGVDVQMSHLAAGELITKICGRILTEKHIPDFVWTLSEEYADAFLDGWKADGNKKPHGSFTRYGSIRPDFLSALSWLGRLNGRIGHIGKYNDVAIRDRTDRKNLSDRVPTAPLRVLRRLLNPASLPWKYTAIFKTNKPSKTVTRKIAKEVLEWAISKRRNKIVPEASQVIHNLKMFIDGDIITSNIKSITKVDNPGKYVYDVSVPRSEMFFGGTSPILLHNTGHGAISSLHADDAETALMRLKSAPLSVPEGWLNTIGCISLIRQVDIAGSKVRRVIDIHEVREVPGTSGDEAKQELVKVFSWDVTADKHAPDTPEAVFANSWRVQEIAKVRGWSDAQMISELRNRAALVKSLVDRGQTTFQDVMNALEVYYATRKVQQS